MSERRHGAATFRRGTRGENSSKAILRPWVGHENGLWMTLDARLGVEADAEGRVTRWNDQGPAGNHVGADVVTERPRKSGFRGRASVLFDGTQFLQSVNPQGTPASANATVIVVADFKMTVRAGVWSIGTDLYLESNDRQGQFRLSTAGLPTRIVHTHNGYAAGTHMVSVLHETTISRIYVNGQRDGSSSLAFAGLPSLWRAHVGHRTVGPGQTFFDSHINTVLMWHRRLPETELEHVHSKTKTAWNLA